MNHKSRFKNHQRTNSHQIKDQQLNAGYWSFIAEFTSPDAQLAAVYRDQASIPEVLGPSSHVYTGRTSPEPSRPASDCCAAGMSAAATGQPLS